MGVNVGLPSIHLLNSQAVPSAVYILPLQPSFQETGLRSFQPPSRVDPIVIGTLEGVLSGRSAVL